MSVGNGMEALLDFSRSVDEIPRRLAPVAPWDAFSRLFLALGLGLSVLWCLIWLAPWDDELVITRTGSTSATPVAVVFSLIGPGIWSNLLHWAVTSGAAEVASADSFVTVWEPAPVDRHASSS